MTKKRPLSHWIAVARMGFERDFHRIFSGLGISRSDLADRIDSSPAYVSKVLNGRAGNFQLSTMAKLARAVDASVQIRLTRDGKETVRVVDYETAAALDGLATQPVGSSSVPVDINEHRRRLGIETTTYARDSNPGIGREDYG